jgi:hypothetical protein
MDSRREELSTADIAQDRPADDLRDEVRDQPRERLAEPDVERGDPGPDRPRMYGAPEPAAPPEERPATGDAPAPSEAPVARAGAGAEPGPPAEPLLAPGDTQGFQARWTDVQNGFVDEPRRAVEEADTLVAELMQHLAKSFADERGRLESQWDRGDDVSTDELRVAFQRYRVFFARLLST